MLTCTQYIVYKFPECFLDWNQLKALFSGSDWTTKSMHEANWCLDSKVHFEMLLLFHVSSTTLSPSTLDTTHCFSFTLPHSRITHAVSMVTVSLQLHQYRPLKQNPVEVRWDNGHSLKYTPYQLLWSDWSCQEFLLSWLTQLSLLISNTYLQHLSSSLFLRGTYYLRGLLSRLWNSDSGRTSFHQFK